MSSIRDTTKRHRRPVRHWGFFTTELAFFTTELTEEDGGPRSTAKPGVKDIAPRKDLRGARCSPKKLYYSVALPLSSVSSVVKKPS